MTITTMRFIRIGTYDDIITRVCVYAQTFISAIKRGDVVRGRRAGRLTHIFTNEMAEGR